MNREIKFRAWDGDAKQMEHWDVFDEFDDHQYYHVNRCAPAIMQFTGLKDKNGVEIYEGDIINDCHDCYQLKVIVYSEDHAGFMCDWVGGLGFHDEYLSAVSVDPKTITGGEVIGNIHENPELLETTNE